MIRNHPELTFFDASPVKKNEYKTLVIEKYPKVGFRQPNSFIDHEVAKLGLRDVKCAFLDASWTMDTALAEMTDQGKALALAIQVKSHLHAAFFELAQQIWYGSKNEADGFKGLHDLAVHANTEMLMDAGGTGPGQTSVFAVSTGLDTCQIVWGSEGHFEEGDITNVWVPNPENTSADHNSGRWDYAQKLSGWAGLQVTSIHAFGRISGLTKECSLTDNLLFELLSRFPAGRKPQAFFMTRRSLEQLRNSRVAVNATGAPVPNPTDVAGIPIYDTDALINNEETLISD